MMKKRLALLLLAAALGLSVTACGDDEDYDEDYEEDYEEAEIGERGDPDQTWAIYWYLCGSDLESEVGFATDDMVEMMEVDLPENVKVVIQTGGAAAWQNDVVDADYIERYLYDSEGLNLVDQQELANMGDPETLADFLSFCSENYPADRTAVVFWNHGGGSVSGVSFDENFGYDSLTLGELYEAFNSVYELSVDNPPFDVIGFDTCLMATVDTAFTFADIGKYLVASEELEPGGGWLYSGFLQELADDPAMDGAMLGKAICDTYVEGCEMYGLEDEITLSVTDLSRVGPLLDAYETMGAAALTCALEDPSFFGDLGRAAMNSENYGGNTRDQGYTNMVDLGHLAKNCSGILPDEAQAVMDTMDDCVIYKVNGPYRRHARGLSCYFSYNGDLDDLHGFQSEGCSETFKYLYDYGLEGRFTEEGIEYINSMGYDEEEVQPVPDLAENSEEEYPLTLNEDGLAVLELDPDVVNMLKGVYFQLAYVDEEEDIVLLLGRDNDIVADWENGVFTENFRLVWGALDDYLVYMDVVYETDDYTVFSVPILLNGEEYSLRVIYDYDDEQFYIEGARKGLDDNGMADRNLVQLRPGDEITTLHYAATYSGDDDYQMVPVDTFTVTEETSFGEVELGDGVFRMYFEMVDAKNNSAFSQEVEITADGDDIETAILE